MRRWLLLSLTAVVVLGVLLRATVLRPKPIAVKAVRVEMGVVEETVTNTKAGTIKARRRARLSPEVGGRVVEIAYREGDHVKVGVPLVRLDSATQTAQLRLAKQNHRAAEASMNVACITRDRALREVKRARQLANKNIVSADGLDQLESAYQTASASCNAAGAEVEKASAQIAVAGVELEKMLMRAPFDGVIAEVAVELGEWITPSPPLLQAPSVLDLIDLTSMYISAPMDEVDSAAIRTGQRAKVTIDSYSGMEFGGEVVRVAPYVLDVEAQNRTVEIEVELGDKELAMKLLPGTSADVEVVLEVRDEVLRLPTSALLEGNRVLVAENGRLVEQSVEIGLKNWDYAEVRSGLEQGQRVVTSLDRVEVEAGARVEVEEIEYTP